MIKPYIAIIKKSFKNNTVYRMDYFFGVLNAIFMIFITTTIWRAIYEEEEAINGIEFKLLATYIILSFLIQCLFMMDEYLIENKIKTGLITADLLKPFHFSGYLLSYHLGTLLFRLVMQIIPTLVFCILVFRMIPPFSLLYGAAFLFSVILSYFLLYSINYLVWLSSFWFMQAFSLVTIKDALIMILSGALLPIWFMPQWVIDIIKLTPFQSIYYIPITIYLGQVPVNEIYSNIAVQFIWIVILFLAGRILWQRAKQRLVLQGG